MSDSSEREGLDAKHEGDRELRVARVKRWVEYVKSEPPETWGPQQNAVVNGQLDAADCVDTSAAHRQQVADIAAAILEEGSSTESQRE
jgi:hypothetical protein